MVDRLAAMLSQQTQHLRVKSSSNAYLKSLGKTQKKQVLSKELWQKLGSLGIRKPFRSKRRKRQSLTTGHPVGDPTGLPPQPEVPTASPGRNGKISREV